MIENPWVERFPALFDKETIRRKATFRPDVLGGLDDLPVSAAALIMKMSLRSIYVPNEAALRLLGDLIGLAYVHCTIAYPDIQTYSNRVYVDELDEDFPMCITGLAGVGKTQLKNAMRRILPANSVILPGPGFSEMPLSSVWTVDAKGNKGVIQLLKKFVNPGERDSEKRITVPQIIALCRKKAYREGVPLLIADEFQFHNQGEASTQVAEALFHLSLLGIPMVYICNYSMIDKLLLRPQEGRQRLLERPQVLMPDLPDSKDWLCYIDECIRVLGVYMEAPRLFLVESLYDFTAGLKRLVVSLFTIAYSICRTSGRNTIYQMDIVSAFSSVDYASSREDVGEIFKLHMGGKSKRKDLICPLSIPEDTLRAFADMSSRRRDVTVNEKILRDSMTVSEKQRYKALKAEEGHVEVRPPPKRARTLPATLENFSAGEALLDTLRK